VCVQLSQDEVDFGAVTDVCTNFALLTTGSRLGMAEPETHARLSSIVMLMPEAVSPP
jgi:hypothetical protein